MAAAAGANPRFSDENGCTPVIIAAQEGQGHRRLLASLGADVNQAARRRTPVYIATQFGHNDIVSLPASLGADVNQAEGGTTPVFMAAQKGHKDTVSLLASLGADVNQARDIGATPLYVAAEYGHKDIVSLLRPSAPT